MPTRTSSGPAPKLAGRFFLDNHARRLVEDEHALQNKVGHRSHTLGDNEGHAILPRIHQAQRDERAIGDPVQQRLHTKGGQVEHKNGKRAFAVLVLYLSTLGVQTLLYWITDGPLIALGLVDPWKDGVSFVIAQGVATVTNFVLQRVLIFNEPARVVIEEEPTR